MKSFLFLSVLLVTLTSCGQSTKEEAENNINEWYKKHENGYSLKIAAKQQESYYGFYSDELNENESVLSIYVDGMLVQLYFNQSIKNIEKTVDAFEKNFMYASINDIITDLDVDGWTIHPRTPVSSTSDGMTFLAVGKNSLSFTLDWESYTVMGYSETDFCKEQRQVMDASIPESCYVSIEKRLPFKLEAKVDLPTR